MTGLLLRLVFSLLWLAALAACTGQEEGGSSTTPVGTTAPETQALPADTPVVNASPTLIQTGTPRPSRTPLEPTPTLLAGYYRNPVLNHDFPDPDILRLEETGEVTYYAYATNFSGVHVQTARSNDLIHWEYLGEAMPRLPEWAVPDFGWTWAPEVTQRPDGEGYILYYTTRFAIQQGGVQCIGAALSDQPGGPFEPVGDGPLICQQDQGGSIDAAFFRDDDGASYILWKNDGNSQGGISWIYIQKLSQDGLQVEGEPTRLIKADQVWEGVLVEGPTLWKHGGKYYLFYSANDYASQRYAAGYAVAETVLGPYEKAQGPFLASNLKAGIVGPGGQDIVTDETGQDWILFHGWTAEAVRVLYIARLDWQDGTPQLGPLTREPLPGPGTGIK